MKSLWLVEANAPPLKKGGRYVTPSKVKRPWLSNSDNQVREHCLRPLPHGLPLVTERGFEWARRVRERGQNVDFFVTKISAQLYNTADRDHFNIDWTGQPCSSRHSPPSRWGDTTLRALCARYCGKSEGDQGATTACDSGNMSGGAAGVAACARWTYATEIFIRRLKTEDQTERLLRSINRNIFRLLNVQRVGAGMVELEDDDEEIWEGYDE
ncbi:hypothetical protein P175DRAFT_0528033 [Aspergillus ochraceoroseus IBT 24754]|uniref:Uncharacterized protein n=1 Tax=Aspergillus ochraceoroseus IBT 24754 TaxID=1392256 RepID=A0A2T5M7M3_9EURO|nr:uncharacterized protein P175DRAFT_0528033 [Aspergillus ochraceoroseus IBT 24754]PTU24541.1 hypothetical protein P175DRAFT_0528033 [Aspergillus ochraceoroseus IBT 24754]